MLSLSVVLFGFMLFVPSAAGAKVSITVDKDAQMMAVAVDGAELYQWPVSTGIPSHETPNGSFRTFRMEEDHYSKQFDDAPMPHAIFFTKFGHAIHGTDSVDRLGSPASHGCVRLSRENASTLFALVQSEGVLNTTVELSGSSQVALARNPRTRPATRSARREAEPPFDAAGNPAEPQQRVGNGSTDPTGGRSAGQRYPAPRGNRLTREATSNSPQTAPRPFREPRNFISFQD